MKKIKYIEEIDKYYSNQMNEEEKANFEKALQKDKELQKAVVFYKDIEFTIENREALKFVDEAMNNLEEPEHHSKVSIFLKHRSLKYAAILVILIIIGIVIVLLNRKQVSEPDSLAIYFKPQKIDFQFRSPHAVTDAIFLEAIGLFNNEDYSQAAVCFGEVYEQDPLDLLAGFYMGLSEIFSGNIEKGKETIEYIYKTGDMNFTAEAQWYLIWCYIQQDSLEQAREHLEALKSNRHYAEFAGKVIKLLDEY